MAERASLKIDGMSCASCASRIEKTLNRVSGISAKVNFASEMADVTINDAKITWDDAIAIIRKSGFEATIPSEGSTPSDGETRGALFDFIFNAVFAAPLFLQMLFMLADHALLTKGWEAVCAVPIQFFGARHFYIRAWKALRNGAANMDVLVVLSTTVTFLYSVIVTFFYPSLATYFEGSAAIIVFVSLGKLLEQRAKRHASSGLRALLALQPAQAHLIREGGVMDVPVAELRVGDIVLLRPGERVPVDGEVLEGRTELDESMLSGEAIPVLRGPSDRVHAGTINTNGILRIVAQAVGTQTTLNHITQLVLAAQASKADVEQMVDRVASFFVPFVIIIAVFTLMAQWAIGGAFQPSLFAAISVLIIACPCSLGLATPTAIMVAASRGASAGILFRDINALMIAKRIEKIVFDKTGTLTLGRPVVQEVTLSSVTSREDLLGLACSLEQNSEHPIGKAIVAYAISHGIVASDVHEVATIPGDGIFGKDAFDQRIFVGSPHREAKRNYPIDLDLVTRLQQSGATVVCVTQGDGALGYIALSDVVRPEAHATIAVLQQERRQIALLTGDSQNVAQRVAQSLGITEVYTDLLPSEKAAKIDDLKVGHAIAMVGDGVNDAPALASADLGIAMGSGSELSIETSDVVLMRSTLESVLDFFSLAKATRAKIRQNLMFAFAYNVCAIPVAALGYLNPMLASAAMALSSVSVILNALGLYRWRPTQLGSR